MTHTASTPPQAHAGEREDERDKFEAWTKTVFCWNTPGALARWGPLGDGEYKLDTVNMAWRGWDASTAQAEELREATAEVVSEAAFLCDRLDDLHFDEDVEREFDGHVRPSLSRLKALLSHPRPKPSRVRPLLNRDALAKAIKAFGEGWHSDFLTRAEHAEKVVDAYLAYIYSTQDESQ